MESSYIAPKAAFAVFAVYWSDSGSFLESVILVSKKNIEQVPENVNPTGGN
jgi:5-deoxy-D-glucuronate isomerase